MPDSLIRGASPKGACRAYVVAVEPRGRKDPGFSCPLLSPSVRQHQGESKDKVLAP